MSGRLAIRQILAAKIRRSMHKRLITPVVFWAVVALICWLALTQLSHRGSKSNSSAASDDSELAGSGAATGTREFHGDPCTDDAADMMPDISGRKTTTLLTLTIAAVIPNPSSKAANLTPENTQMWNTTTQTIS